MFLGAIWSGCRTVGLLNGEFSDEQWALDNKGRIIVAEPNKLQPTEVMTVASKRNTQKSPPAEKPRLTVPRTLKAEVDAKAKDLIAKALRPKHVQPPAENNRFNYITDIKTKWDGHHLYFISTYACPWPKALSPTFESRFARMEYVGNSEFALSIMLHTEEWSRIHDSLTVTQCMKAIRDDRRFVP